MITFDEAVRLIVEIAKPLGKERVAIAEARGRTLATPLAARMSAPRSDVSAMDGYAVKEADLGSFPVRLEIVGQSFPAEPCLRPLQAGECIRIFTGAPTPDGCDRVIVQEIVRRDGDVAIIDQPPGAGRHIRKCGSDFKEGDILLDAGRLMDPRALVAAAAADVPEVEIWLRPRLIALSTGDELVDPGKARLTEGTIPESVSYGVAALSEDWGAQFVGRIRLKDDLGSMEQTAAEALKEADILVVTGGASVGEKDYAKQMLEPVGLDLVFSKIAIKPGKPVWLGRVGGKIIMGLPGNPTSALVTARLLLAPLVAGLCGRDPLAALRWRQAPLAEAIGPGSDRDTFLRARWASERVVPLSNQDSGAQKALAAADLLLRQRPGDPAVETGGLVEVLEF
jgi:molybdopterin molybdotransferase